jgi:Immunity protein Imm1
MQPNHQNITFFDMATSGESSAHTPVASAEELRAKLIHLSKQEPRFVELRSAAGNRLQLGIGGQFACAQFLKQDNLPPYLCAKARTICAKDAVEFVCGGTPTPIPPELCLLFEDAVKIAEYFFETGDRYSAIEWMEV